MNPNVYVCCIVVLIFPVCLGFSDYHSTSFSSSHSSGQSTHSTKVAKEVTKKTVCDAETMNRNMISEYGRDVHYCAYKTLKFLPGSTFTDYDDCMKCECSEKWLTCNKLEANVHFRKHSSGSGIKSQTDCERIRLGCETKWVLKMDHSTGCPKEKIPPDTVPDLQFSPLKDDDVFFDDFPPMPFF